MERQQILHCPTCQSLPRVLYVSGPFGQAEYASIALSRRVSHDDGTFGGVVVASLRLSYFRDLLGQLAVGPHGTISVLRNDGTVFMRLPFDRQRHWPCRGAGYAG